MKKYVVAGLILCVLSFALGAWLFNGNKRVAYWKGRSEQTLQDLTRVEKEFEEEKERDERLQKAKDERIAELEEEVAEVDERIVYVERDIVVTREMLIASGLYQGLVKELDEKWAEKYATLEEKVIKKDAIIKEWEEKFDSKVKLELEGWIAKDIQKQAVIEGLQKRCTAYERQVKGLSLKGTIWKWVAIVGGVKITYDFVRGRT